MLFFHVAISLVGIVTGLIALYGMLTNAAFGAWTALFLAATIITSVTGFPLAPYGLDPPRIVGVISLVLLAAAVVALYGFRLAGPWQWIYVGGAVAALYLNVFVLIAQGFMKWPPLRALAPTQSEPPFVVAQAIVLLVFLVLGALAARRFHPAA